MVQARLDICYVWHSAMCEGASVVGRKNRVKETVKMN